MDENNIFFLVFKYYYMIKIYFIKNIVFLLLLILYGFYLYILKIYC